MRVEPDDGHGVPVSGVAGPAFGVVFPGVFGDAIPICQDVLLSSEVSVVRRDEPDGAMQVFAVVPGGECVPSSPGVLGVLKGLLWGYWFSLKVNENVPPEESEGWTIVLVDRAPRFIFEISRGKKDGPLFKKAVETLAELVEQTDDITLPTDGERRYRSILFEIGHEVIRTGRPGRPRKTLNKGATVRMKNKSSQKYKK